VTESINKDGNAMTTEELEKMVRPGETSRMRFKQRFATSEQLAEDSYMRHR